MRAWLRLASMPGDSPGTARSGMRAESYHGVRLPRWPPAQDAALDVAPAWNASAVIPAHVACLEKVAEEFVAQGDAKERPAGELRGSGRTAPAGVDPSAGQGRGRLGRRGYARHSNFDLRVAPRIWAREFCPYWPRKTEPAAD